jgi:hypothetical protein
MDVTKRINEVQPGIVEPLIHKYRKSPAKNSKNIDKKNETIPTKRKGVEEKLKKELSASFTIDLILYLDSPALLESLRIGTNAVFKPT